MYFRSSIPMISVSGLQLSVSISHFKCGTVTTNCNFCLLKVLYLLSCYFATFSMKTSQEDFKECLKKDHFPHPETYSCSLPHILVDCVKVIFFHIGKC